LRAISPRGFPVWENVQPYFPGQSAEEILGQIRPNAREYAHGLYERVPGEVEARLVQARGELSPAQRISEYPLNTPVPYEISDYRLQELTDYLAQYGLLNQ